MKVLLYMAITPNGMIAKENDDTSWVSKTEWKSFRRMIKRTGNLIIGRRTYDIMVEGGEFKGLEKAKAVVLSRNKLETHNPNIFAAKSPREALAILKKQGFKQTLVAGGGQINAGFMKAGLVDEIFLDVEPVAFGKGIRLFGDADFEARLRLVGTKKLSRDEIQLHYRVVK